jgi:hypothetical protein
LSGTASNAKSMRIIVDGEEKEYARVDLNQGIEEKWK